MGSIIIAMPRYEDANHIAGLIRKHGLTMDIEICESSDDILRVVNAREYGVIICTKKIKGMNYTEMADYRPKYFGMIVLTKDDSLYTYYDNMVRMLMPFKSIDLVNAIESMSNDFYKEIKKKKKSPLARSETEKRIIDEAKALLMEKNGMTEPEAFRYIQKNSMDSGRSLTECAQMVIMLNK